MRYEFLTDNYRTEIEKVVSVWAMFDDEDIRRRPHPSDTRGRSLLEHMVHQSVSENLWFATILGISVTDAPLPNTERLAALLQHDETWWEQTVPFFEVSRSRAWIMTRRIAHTAHHRGQQMGLLRMVNRDVHSNYGPTADTGGLMQNHAPMIYLRVSRCGDPAAGGIDRTRQDTAARTRRPVADRAS